jgi:hypothetical protein
MKPHKWAKEIKAWASGAEIEVRYLDELWESNLKPLWNEDAGWEYRIKPQQSKSENVLGILQWLVNHRGYGDLNQWTLDVIIENFMNDFDCKVESIKLDTTPKEPQYLYVYKRINGTGESYSFESTDNQSNPHWIYIGKIKLEQDDE